jgi:hypothetical protein
MVTDIRGTPLEIDRPEMLATSSPALHAELRDVLDRAEIVHAKTSQNST